MKIAIASGKGGMGKTTVATNLAWAGRIPYDVSITKAQLERKSIVEYDDGPASSAIRTLWQNVQGILLMN